MVESYSVNFCTQINENYLRTYQQMNPRKQGLKRVSPASNIRHMKGSRHLLHISRELVPNTVQMVRLLWNNCRQEINTSVKKKTLSN